MSEMAPLPSYFLSRRKVLLALHLLVFLFACLSASSASPGIRVRRGRVPDLGGRMLLELDDLEEEEPVVPKKKPPTIAKSPSPKPKNQTKPVADKHKDGLPPKNQTKLLKPNSSVPPKNLTKTLKPSNSTKTVKSAIGAELKKLNTTSTIKFKKLNSTSTIKLQKLNSTSTVKLQELNSTSTIKLKKLNDSKSSNSMKSSASPAKKSVDLIELVSPKNKTSKPQEEDTNKAPKKAKEEEQRPKQSKTQKPEPKMKPKQPSWVDQEEDANLVSEFRDLPMRFQQTLIPDLERISTTSKAYITKANKQMTKGFKPYVGHKYAPTTASVVSCAFILIPFLLVSLIFNKIKAYFSLQKLLIFIQIYLSIYFSILCLSSLATGLEPLRFFYATSPSTYICIQVMQTLGYVLYLLMLLMYLVLVFSTDCGLGPKFLGLAQTFVGYAVGLHYYLAVFHRLVQHQPPKTNWKVHGIYAACFLAICLFAQAERRKKAYREDSGEEGKKS